MQKTPKLWNALEVIPLTLGLSSKGPTWWELSTRKAASSEQEGALLPGASSDCMHLPRQSNTCDGGGSRNLRQAILFVV